MRGEISFEMRCKFVANLIELDINLHLYCIKYEEWLTIYDAEYGPREAEPKKKKKRRMKDYFEI